MTLISHLLSNSIFNNLRRFQLLTAVVVYLALMLMNEPPLSPNAYSDKNLHMLGNFLLFASIWVAIGEKVKTHYIFLLAVPFSILAEIAQSLTLSRVSDVRDITANIIGSLLGFTLCSAAAYLYKRNQAKKRSEQTG